MPLRTCMNHGKRSKQQHQSQSCWNDDLEGFKTSVEEGAADVVVTARKVEVEPEDRTELCKL